MRALLPNRFAEIIYALAIGFFGVLHLLNADAMSGIIPTYMPADGKHLGIYYGCGFDSCSISDHNQGI